MICIVFVFIKENTSIYGRFGVVYNFVVFFLPVDDFFFQGSMNFMPNFGCFFMTNEQINSLKINFSFVIRGL